MTSSSDSVQLNDRPLTREEFNEIATRIAKGHLDDWATAAEDVFGIILDDEQKAIVRAVQHEKKIVVKSGTGRGKDFTAAVCCLCFLFFTPQWNKAGQLVANTKVFMTAPTERQIGNIMYPEITRLFKRAQLRGFGLPGRLTGYDIRMPEDEWFLSGFKADNNNVEAWTGLHAVNIMILMTEASGLSELVANAMEGNLQGNYRFMLVFNDNTGSGYAADAMKKKEWAKFRLDSLNAPNVKEKRTIIPGQVDWVWVNEKVHEWCQIIAESEYKAEEGDFEWENENGKHWYRPNDLFRVKVRGMAPKVSEDVLIPPEWVDLAKERWKQFKQQGFPLTAPLRLGTDVAGMGRDNSAFAHRYGNFVAKLTLKHGYSPTIHMEIAGLIKAFLKENTDTFIGKVAQAFIDTIGEGAGVFSRLAEQKEKTGNDWIHVYSCKGSFAAEDAAGNKLTDATGQRTFLNMRAYMYWAMRDWLDPSLGSTACLPEDPELYQELTSIKFKIRSNGLYQIEEKDEIKKRIKRSPDKADALANTFWPVPDVDLSPKKSKNLGGFFH